MIKKFLYILSISLLFIISCAKESSIALSTSASKQTEAVVLTAYASEGGWVSFGETSLRRRSQFWIVRPPGTEINITAESADEYIFSGWSNGWIVNPLTFKLNSDMEITAIFKTN